MDKVLVSISDIALVINTLKGIDVRGFDSMDKLVGVVIELGKWGRQQPVPEIKQKEPEEKHPQTAPKIDQDGTDID